MSGEKYYKQERARQKKFKEAEKKLDEDYKKVIQEELDAEKYSRLFPEDSTKEYNPVEYYKKGGIARIPRKKGQPAGSKKHSDLYTDENPKGTIKGLKFKTESDAKKSVAKIKNSEKTKAHKIQAAVAMEQRAGVMGKASSAGVYRKFIDSAKRSKKAKGGLIRGMPKLAIRGF
jgi:hypothetical protein